MFYLSGNRLGAKYGVIDSDDSVEEFFTVAELLLIEHKGITIRGLIRKCGRPYFFGLSPISARLIAVDGPRAVQFRLSRGLSFTQAIYMGWRIREEHLEFLFFDDSGMSGICVISGDQFCKGGVDLLFTGCDSHRVSVLMRRLKDSGSFIL